ncbi:protein LEG1 homolog [Pelodytes ibericus]
MFLLLWIILCFHKANSKVLTLNDGEGYPPMWDIVPEKLEDFIIQSSKVIINPWNYLERMGMYKILLNVTVQYLDLKDADNKKNILWGLPLQHGWQQQTGRLEDTSTYTTHGQRSMDKTQISPKSWWACMNYYLAVIPFFGAADAGFFKEFPLEIELTRPEEFETDFCYNITHCHASSQKAMSGWKTFFELIKTPRQVTEGSELEDEFLSQMWKAHMESIDIALPRCSKRLKYLSTPEGNFGRDWATAVEFIAATHFPTNFKSTNDFQVYLPPRLLNEGDQAPYITDFTPEENRVLSVLNKINKLNSSTGGYLLRLWKKAMCSEEGRAAGRYLFQNVITKPEFALINILKIIKELIKNSTCDVLKEKVLSYL